MRRLFLRTYAWCTQKSSSAPKSSLLFSTRLWYVHFSIQNREYKTYNFSSERSHTSRGWAGSMDLHLRFFKQLLRHSLAELDSCQGHSRKIPILDEWLYFFVSAFQHAHNSNLQLPYHKWFVASVRCWCFRGSSTSSGLSTSRSVLFAPHRQARGRDFHQPQLWPASTARCSDKQSKWLIGNVNCVNSHDSKGSFINRSPWFSKISFNTTSCSAWESSASPSLYSTWRPHFSCWNNACSPCWIWIIWTLKTTWKNSTSFSSSVMYGSSQRFNSIVIENLMTIDCRLTLASFWLVFSKKWSAILNSWRSVQGTWLQKFLNVTSEKFER